MNTTTRIILGFLLLTAALTVSSCKTACKPQGYVDSVEYMLMLVKSSHLILKSGPVVFQGDKLYEHINGAADTYHDYGFISVTSGELRDKCGGLSVIVDIYDMGSVENAFGKFSITRPAVHERPSAGSGCFYSEPVLQMYQGRFLVELAASGPSAGLKDQLVGLAELISGWLPQDKTLPRGLALLPGKNIVPHSEKYIKRDVLGFSFLKEAWSADYDNGGKRHKLALLDLGSRKESSSAMKKLAVELGGIDKAKIPGSDESFACVDKFLGNLLVARRKGYLVICAAAGKDTDLKPQVIEQLKLLAK